MPMYKKSMLILLVIVIAAVGGTMYGLHRDESARPLDTATAEQAQPSMIAVYVTGAVNKPGVINLKEGSRVIDAVNACGGLLPVADESKINMAQELKDGAQVRVPQKAENTSADTAEGKTASSGKDKAQGSVVNINTADEKELDTLPGIGPAMAKRIIEYRETNGSFQQPEDIKNVKGIGDAKYEKMKDKIGI